MSDASRLRPAAELRSYPAKVKTIAAHIRARAECAGALSILDAGCGTRWDVRLGGVTYTLTGLDSDRAALDLWLSQQRDTDIAILGDLRTVDLPPNSYDVIFSSDVLEHVAGAEAVLENFVRWLKPGGILIVGFPNRDSSYAFLVRMTPFWFHVFFKKHVQGIRSAGQPGCGPFPTVFDRVVSRQGMRAFARDRGLIVKAEYRLDSQPVRNPWLWRLVRLPLWALHLASLGRLSVDHRQLLYVIEKPG